MRHVRTQIRVLVVAALGAALMLAVAAPAASAKPCKGAYAQPATASHKVLARATVCLLNKQRARRGMRKLRMSKRLNRAARVHSADMARHAYFSHNSLSGASFLDRIRRTGYLRKARRWTAGENIAWGTGHLASPKAIVRAWMNSPGHKANILNRRFRHIGVGITFKAPVRAATGSRGGTYTTDFGARS